MQNKKDFLIRAGYWAVILAVVYLCVHYLLRYMAPFLLALVIAAICEKGVLFFKKALHLKRSFLAAVITILLVGGTVALLAASLSALVRQAISFLTALPQKLQQLPALSDHILRRLNSFCQSCGEEGQQWITRAVTFVATQLSGWLGDLSGRWLQAITDAASRLPRLALFSITAALAVFFTVEQYPRIIGFILRQIPPQWRQHLQPIRRDIIASLTQWCRAQLLLLAVTFGELLTGLALLRMPYALLIAALTALIDALPVFGSGIVLLPWAFGCFFAGDFPRGLALCTIYAVVTLVHNIAAPKLLAIRSGVPPLVSLLSLYTGFCILGVWGMLLFPLLTMLLFQLRHSGLLRLWK